jgi:hypothetical protein
MKWIIFITLLFSKNLLALEAVVTVLETPLFKSQDYDSPVVQYLRRGDIIRIHPSVGNDKKISKYAPSREKLSQIMEKIKNDPQYNSDPLFKGDQDQTAFRDDEFIPTLDRMGKTAYVLSSHIYVYFNDAREFDERITKRDPTDYRLQEPLPKNYPLKTPHGLRAQLFVGVNQPNYESYNYPDKIKTKGYSSPLDLSYAVLKLAPGDYQDRLFIGGSLNLRYFNNSYLFTDNRTSEETGLRFGIGPTISYDSFKGEKHRINLSGTIFLNIYDRLQIEQASQTNKESRSYGAYSLTSRLNIQYHRKSIAENVDFILGSLFEIQPPTNYKAKNAGRNPSWWQNLGNDSFQTRTAFNLGAYIGIQSAY